jgi:hypothetical protein
MWAFWLQAGVASLRPGGPLMAAGTEGFYVVSEDGDSLHVTAISADEAIHSAIVEWGLVTEPDYTFKVFRAADAIPFKTVMHAVREEGDEPRVAELGLAETRALLDYLVREDYVSSVDGDEAGRVAEYRLTGRGQGHAAAVVAASAVRGGGR